MSIAVLTQVYNETRRLAIAGSAVAVGDFRLKKLIPLLEKSGEKAPVFAKLAQATQAVVDSDEKTSAPALLDLATLVNAILYTQGETGIAGELQPIETADLGGQQVQASARVLKPLLEALTTTGSGRLELIRDAVERGAFRDLRLVKPALAALDDPYPEVGDLMIEQVLPMYGQAIVAELRQRLDIKGKAGHVRRLRLLHKLDPAATRAIVKQTLEEGSKEMKVAAIECLGEAEEDLSYLLEQTRAKAGDVRAAALWALAKIKSATVEVLAALKKAISGADLEVIVECVRECPSPAIHDFILEKAQQQLTEVLNNKDGKILPALMQRLQSLLLCLATRTDAKTEAFLIECFGCRDKIAAVKSTPIGGTDINELVGSLLAGATPKTCSLLIAMYESLPASMFNSVFHAARRTLPPSQVFEMFSSALKSAADKRTKKNLTDVDRANALVGVLSDDYLGHRDRLYSFRRRYPHLWRDSVKTAATPLPELDPRWLDAAVAARRFELVRLLARPNHAATLQFLTEEFAERSKKKDDHSIYGLLETMVRVRHPEAGDALIAFIGQQSKSAHAYYGYWAHRLIPDLPRSEFPKFEALLPTLPERIVDQLMESVLALKNKPE